MVRHRWPIVATSLGLSAHLLADEPEQSTATPPSFGVTTRLVEVSVIATDKQGHAVTDLTANDFVITDRGHAQALSYCHAKESVAPGSETADLERGGVYFNRAPGAAGSPPGVTIILFDQLNGVWPELAPARQQLLRYLHGLDPRDHVALYSLGRELRLIHDFTQDRQRLIEAADPLRPQLLLDQERDDDDDALANSAKLDRRARATSAAITALANHVVHIPGRKNLVWLASGIPFPVDFDSFSSPSAFDHQALARELERVTRALAAANISVYPVDAAGLVGDAIPGAEFGGDFGPGGSIAPAAGLRRGRVRRSHAGMRVLAESTGGRAYYNTNDLAAAIAQAVADTRFVYTLAYRPDHDRWDGSFHEITLKTRRKGVHLDYRRGYFALPERQESRSERDATLAEAGRSPLNATGIGLQARLLRYPLDAQRLAVELTIDPRALSLASAGERRTGSVDVLLALTATPGALPTYVRDAIDLNLEPATYDAALGSGLRHTMSVTRAAAAQQIRVVVRDARSGAMGSLALPSAEILTHAPPAAPEPTP